jgi:23S rRNA pseudouridine2605 synthase
MPVRKRIGLARALSKKGFCSRSQAAVLIRAGRVALNGRVARDPETPVRILVDHIKVDGSAVEKAQLVYLMLNKPRGVVTTASDERERETVYDLLPRDTPWIGPIGRLDKASEGLLLLTNDSDWSAKITDPASHLDKTYHVQVNCVADEALVAKIIRMDGAEEVNSASAVGDLRAKSARLLRHGEKNSWLEITLDEGKNRQIRRMFDATGVEVLRLVRISIGPLQLGDLKKGGSRELTSDEKREIDRHLAGAPQKSFYGKIPFASR